MLKFFTAFTALFTVHVLFAQQNNNRPQTPKPPFNYNIDSVEYDNADKTVHLAATLTYPKAKGPFAVVVLITGSGLQDRDETIFNHKPFAVIADYLTNNGIAVLRVDDRMMGKSKGDVNNVTSADFANDVNTSIDYLLTRKEIDKKHIGLIGHSEGGIIAPMVAAKRKEVDFIIMWGAPVIGGKATNIEQNIHGLKLAKINDSSIQVFLKLYDAITAKTEQYKKGDDTRIIIQPLFDDWKKQQDSITLKSLYVKDSFLLGQNVYSMFDLFFKNQWMRYFITYKPVEDLKKVKCSVLAINGEKDTQVDANKNLALINKILKESGNKDFQTISFPSLNHLLQTCTTGELSEYAKIEETISPTVLEKIKDWITKRIK